MDYLRSTLPLSLAPPLEKRKNAGFERRFLRNHIFASRFAHILFAFHDRGFICAHGIPSFSILFSRCSLIIYHPRFSVFSFGWSINAIGVGRYLKRGMSSCRSFGCVCNRPYTWCYEKKIARRYYLKLYELNIIRVKTRFFTIKTVNFLNCQLIRAGR